MSGYFGAESTDRFVGEPHLRREVRGSKFELLKRRTSNAELVKIYPVKRTRRKGYTGTIRVVGSNSLA